MDSSVKHCYDDSRMGPRVKLDDDELGPEDDGLGPEFYKWIPTSRFTSAPLDDGEYPPQHYNLPD